MTNGIQIRGVAVEFLRPGPAHNQLLSPLTQYLGICGDSSAGVVTVPYEHAAFLRRLRSLRYDSAEDSDRLPVLRDIGSDMARILGSIPGLPGSLASDPAGPDTLVHLRLMLSASELAVLPFELAKVPISSSASTDSWLALQARVPVCITRRVRNVSSEGVHLPERPRILFIAADPANVPFDEHRTELLEAVRPYLYPGSEGAQVFADGRGERFADMLAIIRDARFEDIVAECSSTEYTHIHFLAHGDVDPAAPDVSYGLVLSSAAGNPDVVSGERLASAVTRITRDRIHRPAVITLATCDSGNVGSVMIPGASFAHALHQAGVAVVLASQFPLSKAGSIAVVRTLYRGLLRGEHPWLLLHQIRTDLHGRFINHSHDWASLVVYEALPADLTGQLEAIRYHQGRRAMNAALEHVDRAVREQGAKLDRETHEKLVDAVMRACAELPFDGAFAVEILGLRASSSKRLAEAAYRLAMLEDDGAPRRDEWLCHGYEQLDRALVDYRQAARGFLVNEGRPVQRLASLHWVMVQMLSVAAVMGRPVPEGAWETARSSAEAYLEHADPEEKAWAHGSLAELWLMRSVGTPRGELERTEAVRRAKLHAGELAKLYPWRDAFPVVSTRRQFARYVDWWGQPEFEAGLARLPAGARPSWNGEAGVVEVASDIVAILERRGGSVATYDTPQQAGAIREPEGRPAGTGRRPAPATSALTSSPATSASTRGAPASAPVAAQLGRPDGPFLAIEMLPAGHGDALWIQYGDRDATSRVLIDCGTQTTYKWLRERVAMQSESEREFELFVLSHIDADHIGGAIPFFADRSLGVRFDDVWFNGWKHLPSGRLGAKQGEIFSTLIQDNRLPWNKWREGGAIVVAGSDLPNCTLPGGMRLTLLSPTPDKLAALEGKWKKEIEALSKKLKQELTPGKAEDFRQFLRTVPTTSTDVDALADARFGADTAAPNGSSIAVLAEYRGKSALLAADAHAPVLVSTIGKLLKQRGEQRLKVDAFKVSHHASQNNLNIELMKLLDCRHYLISTNGSHFNHPDREAIGRIIKYGGERPRLYFNFKTKLNDVWADRALQEKYGFESVYPDPGQEGLVVRV